MMHYMRHLQEQEQEQREPLLGCLFWLLLYCGGASSDAEIVDE